MGLTMPGAMLAAGLMICMGSATAMAAEPADSGRFTARFAGAGTTFVPGAVLIDGKRIDAGHTHVRVDDQTDVRVYSLSARSAITRSGPMTAVQADTSGVENLPEVTALVRASAEKSDAGKLSDIDAAAYQVAIWHLTDRLAISAAQVPDARVRAEATAFLKIAEKRAKDDADCRGQTCEPSLSTRRQRRA